MSPNCWPLKHYLPFEANLYCFSVWETYGFDIKIVNPRATKLGDYRYRERGNKHLITINGDLNSFEFMTVFLHEAAHCATTKSHGIRVKPHGSQWQQHMRDLVSPLVAKGVLPPDIEKALKTYLAAPKASSCSDVQLTKILRTYDSPSELMALEDLPEGSSFSFRKRRFTRLKLRRTRVACVDHVSERTYLISKLALVKPLVKSKLNKLTNSKPCIDPPF